MMGGHISKNDDYKRCLEFYSGSGKIEISAIWQKFLPFPDIAIFDQSSLKIEVNTHMSKNVVFCPKILQNHIIPIFLLALFVVILSILARACAL